MQAKLAAPTYPPVPLPRGFRPSPRCLLLLSTLDLQLSLQQRPRQPLARLCLLRAGTVRRLVMAAALVKTFELETAYVLAQLEAYLEAQSRQVRLLALVFQLCFRFCQRQQGPG